MLFGLFFFVTLFFSLYLSNALQGDKESSKVHVLWHKYLLTFCRLVRAHLNSCLVARAKISEWGAKYSYAREQKVCCLNTKSLLYGQYSMAYRSFYKSSISYLRHVANTASVFKIRCCFRLFRYHKPLSKWRGLFSLLPSPRARSPV